MTSDFKIIETLASSIVIPDAVEISSIRLDTMINQELIIVWSPVTNVNYSEVSYDIRVSYRDGNCTAVSQFKLISKYSTSI